MSSLLQGIVLKVTCAFSYFHCRTRECTDRQVRYARHGSSQGCKHLCIRICVARVICQVRIRYIYIYIYIYMCTAGMEQSLESRSEVRYA